MTQEPCKKCGEYHNNCYELSELTDEEIALIWANYGVPMTGMDFKKVVEAILQKANNG